MRPDNPALFSPAGVMSPAPELVTACWERPPFPLLFVLPLRNPNKNSVAEEKGGVCRF